MSDAIIEFLNETSGGPTISSEAVSIVYSQKGTHSSATNGSNNSIGLRSLCRINCTPTALVAWRPRDINVDWSLYANYYDYGSGQRIFNFMSPSRSPQLIDWWVFDKPTAYVPSDVRFEIYDPNDGSLRWRLYTQPLKIRASLSLNQAIQVPAGKTYAAIFGGIYITYTDVYDGDVGPSGQPVPIGSEDGQPSYIGEYTHGTVRVDSNVGLNYNYTVMDRATIKSIGQPNPDQTFGIPGFLAIDVTGL